MKKDPLLNTRPCTESDHWEEGRCCMLPEGENKSQQRIKIQNDYGLLKILEAKMQWAIPSLF